MSDPTVFITADKDGWKIGSSFSKDDGGCSVEYTHISIEAFVERTENLLRITDHLSSTSQHPTMLQKLENAESLYEERFSHATSSSSSSTDIEHRLTLCMAKTYMKLNHFPSAIEQYNKLLLSTGTHTTSSSHDLLLNIGIAYFHLEEFERAGFYFQQIFEKNPSVAANRFFRRVQNVCLNSEVCIQ